MKVVMLEEIDGKGFWFKKGEIYKALDGDKTDVEALKGKVLVRQPNSPKKKDWWYAFSKGLVDKKITIIWWIARSMEEK